MTNNVTPIATNEDIAVRNYAVRIKEQISNATIAWKEVARLFAEAANDFGLKSQLMTNLLEQTNFSKSKAVKLIEIVNCKRLQENEETFKCVEAWTVLYSITTLTDDEFAKLLNDVDDETVITQSVVNRAKTQKKQEVDDYETVFTIKISASAMKSGEFDEYSELYDAVQNIQDTIKYVRVDEADFYDNETRRLMTDIDNKYQSLATALVNRELKKYRQANKFHFEKYGYGNHDKESMIELKREGRFAEALDAIDAADTFDQNALYTEAQRQVFKSREEKYKAKIKEITAFAFANTEIQKAA